MPIPAFLPAAIGAAGSLIGGLLNSGSQNSANQQQEAFTREMYEKQKSDSMDMWNKQNEYNSPQSQMSRLQSAGLNPNLVYGNGSAVNTASPINVPSQGSYHPTASRPGDSIAGLGSNIASMFDAQIKNAQLDNMKKQNTLLDSQNLLTLASARKTDIDSGLGSTSLEFAQKTLPNRIAQIEQDLNNTIGRNKINAVDLELKNIQFGNDFEFAGKDRAMALKNAAQDLLNKMSIRANTDLNSDATRFENQLRVMGLKPSSPEWMRVIGVFLKSQVAKNLNLVP